MNNLKQFILYTIVIFTLAVSCIQPAFSIANGSGGVDTYMTSDTIVFKPKEAFSIISATRAMHTLMEERDTLICKQWDLSKTDIQTIIKEFEPINGHEWHYLFSHYACYIYGQLTQGEHRYEYAINAGAWMTLTSGDSTVYYALKQTSPSPYFIDTMWDPDQVEK